MTPKIGDRVVINTNGRLKWADGKTGTVVLCDGWIESEEDYRVTVRGDGMDPIKPPYGMITVRNNEVEPEHETTIQTDIHPDDKEKTDDPVNHPSHYTDGKYECIDFIESEGFNKDGYVFNAIKYISRAGKKDPEKRKEDLEKAIWYLERKMSLDKANLKSIPVDDYVRDKGLEGTLPGLALKMIDGGGFSLAAEALRMELNTHEEHPLK